MIHDNRPTAVCLTAAALTVMLLAAGCSDSNVGRVAGKVTVGGEPVSEGSVVFEDAEAGISVNASLQGDGSYTAKTFDKAGLPPGTYRVAVTPRAFGDGEPPLVGQPVAQTETPPCPIPEKYRAVATSGLTVTVEAGDNRPFDFDLVP